MKGFLDYIDGNSLLHKMHPLVKLILSISICITAFASSSYIVLLAVIALNLLLAIIAGIFSRAFNLLRGLIKISLFLFIIQVLIIRRGEPVFSIGSFPITDTGLLNGAYLVLRLMGATLPLSIMISVTKLSDLSNVLVNNLHIPYKYAFTFTTAIKFIPLFGNEMNYIMEAQTSRGVDFETKNPFKKLSLVLPLCVPLLLSSVKRIDSSAIATELRGFHLRKKGKSVKIYPFKFIDFLTVLISAGIIAAGFIF